MSFGTVFYHYGIVPPMVNVLYITGQSHSGSTLLTLLLGAHTRVHAPGEIKGFSVKATKKYIRKFRPDEIDTDMMNQTRIMFERPCTCGVKQITDCPYWRSINAYLLAHHDITLPGIDVGLGDRTRFVRNNTSIFEAFQAISGKEWIVDSSKTLNRLLELRHVPNLNIVTVYLVRNPLGVVYSEHKRGRSWLFAARAYLKNEWQRRRALRDIPHIVLTYEQLVRQPDITIRRCMHAMGLEYQPQQRQWAEHEQHIFQGNQMRFSTDSAIREDAQWRTGLKWWQKSLIATMMLPLRFNPPHHISL